MQKRFYSSVKSNSTLGPGCSGFDGLTQRRKLIQIESTWVNLNPNLIGTMTLGSCNADLSVQYAPAWDYPYGAGRYVWAGVTEWCILDIWCILEIILIF